MTDKKRFSDLEGLFNKKPTTHELETRYLREAITKSNYKGVINDVVALAFGTTHDEYGDTYDRIYLTAIGWMEHQDPQLKEGYAKLEELTGNLIPLTFVIQNGNFAREVKAEQQVSFINLEGNGGKDRILLFYSVNITKDK